LPTASRFAIQTVFNIRTLDSSSLNEVETWTENQKGKIGVLRKLIIKEMIE